MEYAAALDTPRAAQPARGSGTTWQLFAAAPLLATTMRVIMLWSVRGENIAAATLQITPGSIASFLLDPPDRPSVGYAAASMISLQELAWAFAIGAGVRQIAKVRVVVVAAVDGGLWPLIALLQLGIILIIAATV